MRDYECDFTFIRNASGICTLNPMEKFPSMESKCKDGKWTGYRKIPGSKCQGGAQLQGVESRDCIKYKEDGGISLGNRKMFP